LLLRIAQPCATGLPDTLFAQILGAFWDDSSAKTLSTALLLDNQSCKINVDWDKAEKLLNVIVAMIRQTT